MYRGTHFELMVGTGRWNRIPQVYFVKSDILRTFSSFKKEDKTLVETVMTQNMPLLKLGKGTYIRMVYMH